MTTTLTVKNGVICLPNQIGKRLENKTVRLTDNGLTISITAVPLSAESGLVKDKHKSKPNLGPLKSALKNAIGVFPKNLNGIEYENNIRKGWNERLKKFWHEE